MSQFTRLLMRILTERQVFMTRRDLACVHEPFGDAFYYGYVTSEISACQTSSDPDIRPERLSSRFESDETTREASGFSKSTYQTIFDRLEREGEDVSVPLKQR
jgi:hypothetical protein